MYLPNKRPDDMERIVNEELALKFIDEQVKLVREQVQNKKVLLDSVVPSNTFFILLFLNNHKYTIIRVHKTLFYIDLVKKHLY